MFTGRELDAETGLFYYRARYFSADLGRFLARDPIEADINLYRYCSNNSVLDCDPSGLIQSRPHGKPVDVGGGVIVSVHSESGVPNAGNVHVQIGGTKYYVDAQTGQLFQRASDGSRITASARLQGLVDGNQQVQRNIGNAMRRVLASGGFAQWTVRAGVMGFALYGYDAYVVQGAEIGNQLVVKYGLCNLLNVLDADGSLPNKRVFDFFKLGTLYHVTVNERNGRYYFDVWHTEERWSWTLLGYYRFNIDDLTDCPAPCRGQKNGIKGLRK